MPATRELLELQSVDGELAVHHARLSEIAPLLGDDSAIRALTRRLASEQAEVDSALGRQQEFDSVIAGFTERVDAAEGRLYSGVVVNPRELQDLQADVNMLKRQRGQQEDALLEVMVELDTARGKRDASAKELEELETSWSAEQESLSQEQRRLQAEVADLEGQRASVVGRIPPPETALYEQVRRNHPHPVAQMHNNACNACRVGVPMRTAQEVRTSQAPVRCPNCGRILLPE
ncbi:MAG: C4-type zinc ribbon domain-containing protein [Chloroflexota bacterium]|nr:C4-type zinc ribbon domain-containing protein [Chloroflexota bacterium]MDE2883635.1 C4-type zinc ribbon domain-containing protein [Chloroflexota bacterium]